jgi:hypothetical protein
MNDEIERIRRRLGGLSDSSSLIDSDGNAPEAFELVSQALLASLEGHRPETRIALHTGAEHADCASDGECWPCSAVRYSMEELGLSELAPALRQPRIPDESKQVIHQSLDTLRHTLKRLWRAGAVVSSLTQDHKLALIEVFWPGIAGPVGAVEWDAEVEDWIVTDRPV